MYVRGIGIGYSLARQVVVVCKVMVLTFYFVVYKVLKLMSRYRANIHFPVLNCCFFPLLLVQLLRVRRRWRRLLLQELGSERRR